MDTTNLTRPRRHDGALREPLPEPDNGRLLLRMAYAGLFPELPGRSGTGVVAKVGGGVSRFVPGQRVFVEQDEPYGCCADYLLADARCTLPLPDGAALDKAAALYDHFIVWSMLAECFPVANSKTLFLKNAANSAGVAVLQLAPLLGMRVIAGAGSEEECELLRSLNRGAEVFCHSGTDFGERLRALTSGRGADIILDGDAGEDFCSQLDYLAPMGSLLVCGHAKGYPRRNVLRAMDEHCDRCPDVRVFSPRYFDDKPVVRRRKRAELFRFLAEGRIHPYIGGVFGPAELPEALARLEPGLFHSNLLLRLSDPDEETFEAE